MSWRTYNRYVGRYDAYETPMKTSLTKATFELIEANRTKSHPNRSWAK
jgi:hypothetical protein